MADNTTGLPVKTVGSETVSTKLVDTGGTNVASVSAGGALKVDGSAATQPVSGTVTADTELPAAAALADSTSNPTTSVVGSMLEAFDGSTWDRLRTTDASDGNTALTTTGILNAGVGPGFARRFNPSNLGTANNSVSAVDVNGAGTAAIETNTSTTGTFILEVTIDGTTWISAVAYDVVGAAFVTGSSLTPTVGKVYLVQVNGMRQLRLRTNSTLGATMAHQITLSLGDAITFSQASVSNPSIVVDNAGFTDGTTSVSMSGFVFDEVAGTALTENDAAAARIDSKRAIVNVLEDATTRGQRAAISSAGALSSNLTHISGTTIVSTGLAGTLATAGSIAHDGAAASLSPVLIGAYASAAAPTSVSADGDAVDIWALRNGSQVVNLASGGTLITVGQTTMSASLPVTLASNQSAFPGQYTGDAAATSTPIGMMGMALANSAAPTNVSANNDAVSIWALQNGSQVVNLASGSTLITVGQKAMASSIPVVIASDQSSFAVTVSGVATAANQTNVQVVDNAAFTDGTTTLLMGGYIFDEVAGTALTENDAAAARLDSKRAQIFVGEDATTRGQRWSVSAAGALASNITQVGGSTMSATVPLSARLTDGSAYYTKTGQTAGTAAYTQISDQTNVANVIAGTNALKVDISSVRGTVDSATQALSVRLTNGTSFYAADGSPTSPQYTTVTSSSLGAGANTTLNGALITNGTTGYLTAVDVASTVPLKIEIQTVNSGGTATTRSVLFCQIFGGVQWRSPHKSFITQAGAASNAKFAVKVTNLDSSTAADVYATILWDEI